MNVTEIRNKIITEVCKVKEKGYVNNPNDSGGETNHGIIKKTARRYRHLWKNFNWNGDMKTMPVEFAMEVYRIGYWDEMYLDAVVERSEVLAELLMDIGVNYSTEDGQRWLQRILNVMNNRGTYYEDIYVDGDIGPQTIRALDAYRKKRGSEGLEVLATAVACSLGNHYLTLAERREKDETFYYGWMRARVYQTQKEMFLEND